MNELLEMTFIEETLREVNENRDAEALAFLFFKNKLKK